MLRITSGELRGRMLKSPKGLLTRPTQARLRQALFNSVQMTLPEARVLDLFAGSGALGFEALSRGASHVTFVEDSKFAIKIIAENAKDLGVLGKIEIISESVDRAVQKLLRNAPFELVLADPPYEDAWEMKLLQELGWPWEQILAPSGFFCLEWGVQKSQLKSLPEQVGSYLVKVREKNYGDSVLTSYSTQR